MQHVDVIRILNPREIAHEGFLSAQDFKIISPDVIFLHLNWNRVSSGNLNDRWDEMNRNIMCFASQENYYLSAFWSNNPKIMVGGSNSWLVLTRGRDKNINLQVKLSKNSKMLNQKLALDDFTSSFGDWKEKIVDCSNT